jgi:hypothetical protein
MTDLSFHQANPGIEVSVKPGMAHEPLPWVAEGCGSACLSRFLVDLICGRLPPVAPALLPYMLHDHTFRFVLSWYLDTERSAMADRKNMTLRLTAEQADELEVVARAEGISVSDAVREAIAEHIDRKRKDKAFRERLRTVMERDREILERLAR